MAKKFGFFNSINGDRKYLASDISQAFDIGVTTGIKAEENNLKVVAYEGMQVQIQPGSAMIFGHFFMNDEPEIIDIDTADAELNRIDRVVLRYDAYAREINTAVIKGTPGVNPVPPARLETKEQFDLVLADIYIPAAATEINQSNITDMRDSELCGYIGVKGAVSQLDFDAHLAEYSALGKIEYVYIPEGTQTRFDVPLRTSLFFVLTENNDNKTTIINVTRFGTGGLVYQTVVSGTAITIHTNADKSAVFLTPTFSVRGFVVRAIQPI